MREVIILHKLLKSLLVGILVLPSISTVSAASMPSSYNNLTSEEKKAFDKIYQQSSDSTLQNVNVNYSTELSGLKDISSYHWTAWKKAAKGGSISKSANSGKGVGSGSYKGFTQKKIDSWKVDEKYINAIKKINKGKFPKDGNYTFPTDTSSSKLDWWVDEVGFYDIMGDPKYSKVTAKGYRTFNWTEKVKKEKIERKTDSQPYKKTTYPDTVGWGYHANSGTLQMDTVIKMRLNQRFKLPLSNTEAEKVEKALKDSYSDHYDDGSKYEMNYSGTFNKGNTIYRVQIAIGGDTSDKINPTLVYITVTEETKEYYYETQRHTKKEQIAQTVVARNAYASEIQKYGNFYLTPKSNVSSQKIKTRNTGFWYNINPYYHKGSASVTDEGSYGWTFSTNVSSGKSGTNIYAMLPVKYKFYTDIVDSHYYAPDVGNPPKDGSSGSNNGNNNNNGGNNGGDKPNGGDSNNPGGNGNGNNSNNGGNGNNNGNNGNSNNSGNGGHSSIGDKGNSPMIHIEIDAKDEDGRVGTVRVPKMVHLYDIDKYRKK